MSYYYYKPKEKVNKFSDYFDVLDVLFHMPHGFSEDELRYHIEQTRGTNSREPDFIFNTLLKYGLIVETNDFQPRYVLGSAYRALMEHLYQDSQPVNSAVIQGYISALDQCAINLHQSYEEGSAALTLRHLQRLGSEMDSISQTSSRNRLGVINEVRKLRTNDDLLSYKERLAEANRLWDEYLEPLREMISPTGSFGAMMERLKQTLDSGEALFNSSVELRHQFGLNRTKRMHLQEQARHDLNEASAELDPLREKLMEESRLLAAASLVFDYLEQGKLNELPSLSLGRRLSHERQIDLYGLAPWLANLWSIKAEPDSFQLDEQIEIEPEPLETEAVLQLLKEMPANVDLIHYFQQQHENLSANSILRAISIAVLHQTDVPVVVTMVDREYEIDGQVWQGSSYCKTNITGVNNGG